MLCDSPDDSASRYGLGSGDLAIPYHRAHEGTWGYVFGDSWNGPDQTGTYLGSPVILVQNRFDCLGNDPIRFTGALPDGAAKKLFTYSRDKDNGHGVTEVSRIPNDAIEIGTRTYIQYTSVNRWVGRDSEVDGSGFSGVAYSDDYGKTWKEFEYHWSGQALGIHGNPYGMWTFAGADASYVYVLSKRWNGSHNYVNDGGWIQLFRLPVSDFHLGNWSAQENWAYAADGWDWYPTSRYAPSDLALTTNNLGELSVKKIGPTWVMSYFDCVDASIKTRTASSITGPWSPEKIQVVSSNHWPPSHWLKPQQPNLYGGYIHPGSSSERNLTLMVSQWDGVIGHRPYAVTQWSGLSA